jgi:hypothetical protein
MHSYYGKKAIRFQCGITAMISPKSQRNRAKIGNREKRENFGYNPVVPDFRSDAPQGMSGVESQAGGFGKTGTNQHRNQESGKIAELPPIRDNRFTTSRG